VTEPPTYDDDNYGSFAPRQLREVPDERVQIGYRLARLPDLDVVHGIDELPSEGEPDYFPYGSLQTHVDRTGQAAEFSAITAATQRMLEDFEGRQKTATVAELLIVANQALSDASVYCEWLRFDVAEAQPASELIAYFYMRNAKIFAKLVDVTEPGDRVVVVFGAGHEHWLEHFVESTPGFELIDPVPYLQRAVGTEQVPEL
jgi:hypothetical protein